MNQYTVLHLFLSINNRRNVSRGCIGDIPNIINHFFLSSNVFQILANFIELTLTCRGVSRRLRNTTALAKTSADSRRLQQKSADGLHLYLHDA